MAESKYPYANLRKSLRLLIEDPDPLEELENDISYVYSGYAPISVRLVQCVAQKGGVLSNPAAEKERKGADGDSSRKGSASTLVQAHPIVGWKGFEDVIASIPGETVDTVQRIPGTQDGSAVPSVATLSKSGLLLFRLVSVDALSYSASKRTSDNDRGIFPGRLHLHGDCSPALGGSTEQRLASSFVIRTTTSDLHDAPTGRKFLIATTGIINGSSMIDSIVGTTSVTSKEVGL